MENGRVPIYDFETIKNNGNLKVMKKLIDLKNIFAKQLPKMPKEYISRLMFDKKHESIAIKDDSGKIFGESAIECSTRSNWLKLSFWLSCLKDKSKDSELK